MHKILILPALILLIAGCGPKPSAETATTPVESSTPAPTPGPPLPVFNLTNLDGSNTTTASLPDNLILIFFNPGCDHCQREATAIHGRKKEFSEHEIWFVSVDSLKNIADFRKEYQLTDSNFHFAGGDVEQIVTAMGPIPSVPCIYIYRDRRMVTRLEGEAELDEILRFAEGSN